MCSVFMHEITGAGGIQVCVCLFTQLWIDIKMYKQRPSYRTPLLSCYYTNTPLSFPTHTHLHQTEWVEPLVSCHMSNNVFMRPFVSLKAPLAIWNTPNVAKKNCGKYPLALHTHIWLFCAWECVNWSQTGLEYKFLHFIMCVCVCFKPVYAYTCVLSEDEHIGHWGLDPVNSASTLSLISHFK